MPITLQSIREPLPPGAVRAQLQADGTVIVYMLGDELPEAPAPDAAAILAAAKLDLQRSIDTEVDAVYAQAIGERQFEYTEAERQAQAYKDAGYTGTVPGFVASWVAASGLSAQAAADNILAQGAAWRGAAGAMRAARLGHKAQAAAAQSQDALDAVRASWAATIAQIRTALGL